MKQTAQPTDQPTKVTLAKGHQAVINGALITASSPCILSVSEGAFVLIDTKQRSNLAESDGAFHELYLSILEAGQSEERFARDLFRLFRLLASITPHCRTKTAIEEANKCSTALMRGEIKAAADSAACLAATLMAEAGDVPPKPTPMSNKKLMANRPSAFEETRQLEASPYL